MFRNIVFSAFGAALAIAVIVSALQFATTEPLILHAEQYEGGGHDHAAHAAHLTLPASPRGEGLVHVDAPLSDLEPATRSGLIRAALQTSIPPRNGEDGSALRAETGGVVGAHLIQVHSEAADGEEEWSPADGIERSLYTVLANLVIGFAGALMLLGAMTLKGETIDARRGLLWGLGAFAALSLLPSLGLPPELPGTPAAELADRQLWWLGTAAASAFGIGFLVYGANWGWRAAGLALLVAPHVVGAPVPPSHDVAYPGALAGEFVTASLVVSLVLWSLAGLVGGALHQRLAKG